MKLAASVPMNASRVSSALISLRRGQCRRHPGVELLRDRLELFGLDRIEDPFAVIDRGAFRCLRLHADRRQHRGEDDEGALCCDSAMVLHSISPTVVSVQLLRPAAP